MQEVVWNRACLKRIRNFPNEIRKEIGYHIFKLQMGEAIKIPHSRPMPSIGNGCHELRIKGEDGIFRVFYFMKLKNKIIVFHAFQKKTERTEKSDIEIARKNLKELIDEKN